MNHIYMVKLSRASSIREPVYEVVALNATTAIVKAKRQGRRDYGYRGTWQVEEVLHRGFAV